MIQHHRTPDDGSPSAPDLTIAQLVERFLADRQSECSPVTIQRHRRWLGILVAKHGEKLARQFGRYEATKSLMNERHDSRHHNHPCTLSFKRSTACLAMQCCGACWEWGRSHGLLKLVCNPFRLRLVRVQKNRATTPSEFRALLRACPDAESRQVLLVARYTGARPSAIRTWKWSMLSSDTQVIENCSVREWSQRRTILPLPIRKLIQWRRRRSRIRDPIFLTREGRPWRDLSLNRLLAVLCQKTGIGLDKNGEKLVFNCFRRAFVVAAIRFLPVAFFLSPSKNGWSRDWRAYRAVIDDIYRALRDG